MAYGSAANSNSVSFPFPDDNVHPRLKEDKIGWGLPLAKAIWYNRAFNNPYLFHNVRKDYYERINFALGLNNPDEFKPMLGVNPNEASKSFIPNMDWSIKNYATKRVNIATAKITNRQYDPVFQPGDPFSLNRERNYRNKLKAFMDQQEFLQEMSKMVGADTAPEDVDPDLMPQNDTELDVHMKINYKDRAAAWLEKRTKYFFDRNRYPEIKSNGAFFEFVLGVRVEHVDSDPYGRPRVRSINPAKFIGPYLETPFPVNIQYGADVDFYEIADARKLWEKEGWTAEYENQVINDWATTEDLYYDSYGSGQNSTSTKKIKILRFEYRSLDEKVYVDSRDGFGNRRFVERDFNFYKSPQQQAKFAEMHGKKATLIRDGVDTIYTGYWIVDSDIILKYGRKEWQEGEWGALGQGRIGYKICAPNLRDGKVISTIDQMIPVLRELQRYHLKIQHIVAASVPKGIGIDLEALRRADLKGPNGILMTDLEKIKFYQQTGIFVFNPGDGSIYGRGASQKPIYEVENGVAQDLTYYVGLIDGALKQLDEIIGLNEISSASPVHERKGARVAQIQQQSTETALWYLYEGDAHIYKEVCKSLAIKAIQSELYKPGYYKEAFGESSAQFIRKHRLDKVDFGLMLEIQPTPEEWQAFYESLKEHQRNGLITASQETLLRRVPTLKEAEALLRLFEERTRRQAAEAEQANIQNNAKVQSDVAQQTHAGKLEIEKERSKIEMGKMNVQVKLEQIKGAQEMQQIYIQAFLDGKLTENEIRVKGDEDAQIAVLKGQIQKDIERIKARNQSNSKPKSKAK